MDPQIAHFSEYAAHPASNQHEENFRNYYKNQYYDKDRPVTAPAKNTDDDYSYGRPPSHNRRANNSSRGRINDESASKLGIWIQKIAEANDFAQKLGTQKTYSILPMPNKSGSDIPHIKVYITQQGEGKSVALRTFHREHDALLTLAKSQGLLGPNSNGADDVSNCNSTSNEISTKTTTRYTKHIEPLNVSPTRSLPLSSPHRSPNLYQSPPKYLPSTIPSISTPPRTPPKIRPISAKNIPPPSSPFSENPVASLTESFANLSSTL